MPGTRTFTSSTFGERAGRAFDNLWQRAVRRLRILRLRAIRADLQAKLQNAQRSANWADLQLQRLPRLLRDADALIQQHHAELDALRVGSEFKTRSVDAAK